jgi:hypothetical protein
MAIKLLGVYFLMLYICLASALDIKLLARQWNDFKLTHRKRYATTAEESLRFKIWRSNLKFVDEHNTKANASFTLKINRFGDLTVREFERTLDGFDRGLLFNNKSQTQLITPFLKLKDTPPAVGK